MIKSQLKTRKRENVVIVNFKNEYIIRYFFNLAGAYFFQSSFRPLCIPNIYSN